MGNDLSSRHARFVEEYLIDANATQAAIRAGYSPKSADVQGSRLLGNVKVASAIADAQEERSKRTRVAADWVLNRLVDEAEADLADLYNQDGSLKAVHEWPEIWRKGLVSGIDVEEMRVEGAVVGQVRKVKLSERLRRVELIGKHVEVQAFREQVEQSGNLTVNISGKDSEL